MPRLSLCGGDYRALDADQLAELKSSSADSIRALRDAKEANQIAGAVILSTCNRVELLIDHGCGELEEEDLVRLLGLHPRSPLVDDLYWHQDQSAAEHLLRVATGLHSMVAGEDQILGQVGEAFRLAEESELLSRSLHMLRSRVVAGARNTRQRSRFPTQGRSVAQVAVRELLREGRAFAVVGMGQTGQLAARSIRRRGHDGPLYLVNRNLERAASLSRELDAHPVALQIFLETPPPIDGCLFAIRTEEPIVASDLASRLRRIVDISMPSVLEPRARHAASCEFVDMDELRQRSQSLDDATAAAIQSAESLMATTARRIWDELSPGRRALGAVIQLHTESALSELEHALRKDLRHLDETARESVRHLVVRAARKTAHYHLEDLRRIQTP